MARERRNKKDSRPQKSFTKIIGEGLTERYYSSKVHTAFKTEWKVEKKHFRDSSPQSLYELAIEQLSLNHTVYCLVDKDKARDGDNTAKIYIEKLEKLDNENDKFTLCATMPCIEYWFLIHNKQINRFFANDKEVIKELLTSIPNYDKTEKYLKTNDLEAHLLKAPDYSELKRAITYAKNHPHDASHSSMHQLFKDISLN